MTELEVAAFRRDCAALAGHVRGGLRGDGFGETARQALDKLVTLAYGAAGMGEEAACRPGAISAFSPEQLAELERPVVPPLAAAAKPCGDCNGHGDYRTSPDGAPGAPCDTCDGHGFFMVSAYGPQEVKCDTYSSTGNTLEARMALVEPYRQAALDMAGRYRDMEASRDEAQQTLARLADGHTREMAEATRLLDECREAWRRRGLALQDCRSWLLGRLTGVTGPMLLTSVEKALGGEANAATDDGLPAGRSDLISFPRAQAPSSRAGQPVGHCGVRECGTAAVCRCDCPQCDDARGGEL